MTTEPPANLRILEANAVCAMAEYEHCLLIVWRLQPTRAMFERRHEALLELSARAPGKCGYFEMIQPSSKPPSDELRKNAVDVFRKLGRSLGCIGFVIEGGELRAALVRAILTTMTFLVAQMQPSKVFKHLRDLGPWARGYLGEVGPEFDPRLLAAFAYLRDAPLAHASST